MNITNENYLTENGQLIFKHKTNKNLFLYRPYAWQDRVIILDETNGREFVAEFLFSTYDFKDWVQLTPEELKKIKTHYKDIYGD